MPAYLVESKDIVPQIQIRYDSPSNCGEPNVLVLVSWFNMIKSVRILYNDKSARFEADTLFTHDMGN